MRLWGNKSGPCMQVLHFSWAFGAFTAPLIAKHFIQEEISEECSNSTTVVNITSVNINYSSNINETSCDVPSSQFSYAYYVTASLFLPSLVAFIFYAFRRELIGRCCTEHTRAQSPNERQSNSENDETSATKYPLCYLIILFNLIFSFMFIYVGLEAGFGSLIFTVAVTGELGFSKSSAALLQSVYWGTFAFTRLISVTLVILKVRATIMIMGNIFGSFVASLIMTFYVHSPTAIWLGSAVLGMSYASIFPTVMTWMSENAKASGKATAVLVTGGTLGDIVLPAVMGALVANVNPDSLIYFTFSGVIVSAGIAALMFLTACLQKRIQEHGSPRTQYKRLNRLPLEDKNEVTGTENGGGDISITSDHCDGLNSNVTILDDVDNTESQTTPL